MTGPLVTVVIPCFNYARYLGAAIASVRRQQYEPLETIVVDDGSIDGTAEVAGALGVEVIRRANGGVGAARNSGLEAAHGALVVFLDADDELLPGAISSGVAALAAVPEAACVVRCCESMNAEGQPMPTTRPALSGADLYREWLAGHGFTWTPGAAMFRRDRLAAIGGFPASLGPAADYAVYLTLSRSGNIIFDAREAVRYRQHDANMSRNGSLMLAATLEVLRLERQYVRQPAHMAAIRAGESAWRGFYGDRIVEQLRASWRARRCGRAELVQLWMLARYCPAVVARHLRRKLSVIVHGRRQPETIRP